MFLECYTSMSSIVLEVYQDGRLLMVANQFDRMLQSSRTSGKVSFDQIKENIRSMVAHDVSQDIPEKYVVPASAQWAWCSRMPLEDEDDLEYWKKKFEKNFGVRKEKNTSLKKFIENASGINQIEHWYAFMIAFNI